MLTLEFKGRGQTRENRERKIPNLLQLETKMFTAVSPLSNSGAIYLLKPSLATARAA